MMITALVFCLWFFGVACTLYGSTALYWAWNSPEENEDAKWFIAAGLTMLLSAMKLMTIN
jgi:hypothetical protein